MDTNFNPKVSIVIPVYNGEKYIEKAINSAINQSYKNKEIIVVNDGSTDNTENIVKLYENKIKYFSKKNGGVSTALNLAIKNMTGEYFSWLSHDDTYSLEKIEKQIDFLKEQEEKDIILYSDFNIIDEKNYLIKKEIKNHEELVEKPEYALLTGAINGITLLIPKKAFVECGLFNEKLYCTQDYEMWMRMFKKYKFIHQQEILANSRVHLEQETNMNPKVLTEGNELWIRLIDNFDKETKIKLEGSEYKFYLKVYNYLKSSQYYAACNYAKRNAMKLKEYKKQDFRNIVTIEGIAKKIKTFIKLLFKNPKKLKVVITTKMRRK